LRELNRRLGKKGLKVVSKGRGGVVRTLEEAKLSAVDRDFSWGKLRTALEERREHRRQLGVSLVGRLRRQHFGRQQDTRAEGREDNGVSAIGVSAIGVSAILARRVEATHLAGQGYLASVALSRQPRGEAREGRRQVRQGERGGAAGGDGHLSPVELEIPGHDSIFRADSASGEEEKEGPAAEEPEGAVWARDVLAGQRDFSGDGLGEQLFTGKGPRPSETGESPAETADPPDEHGPEREAPPQSPDEAASAAEDGSEPSEKVMRPGQRASRRLRGLRTPRASVASAPARKSAARRPPRRLRPKPTALRPSRRPAMRSRQRRRKRRPPRLRASRGAAGATRVPKARARAFPTTKATAKLMRWLLWGGACRSF
jgi:hypothetical protein